MVHVACAGPLFWSLEVGWTVRDGGIRASTLHRVVIIRISLIWSSLKRQHYPPSLSSCSDILGFFRNFIHLRGHGSLITKKEKDFLVNKVIFISLKGQIYYKILK